MRLPWTHMSYCLFFAYDVLHILFSFFFNAVALSIKGHAYENARTFDLALLLLFYCSTQQKMKVIALCWNVIGTERYKTLPLFRE